MNKRILRITFLATTGLAIFLALFLPVDMPADAGTAYALGYAFGATLFYTPLLLLLTMPVAWLYTKLFT